MITPIDGQEKRENMSYFQAVEGVLKIHLLCLIEHNLIIF